MGKQTREGDNAARGTPGIEYVLAQHFPEMLGENISGNEISAHDRRAGIGRVCSYAEKGNWKR